MTVAFAELTAILALAWGIDRLVVLHVRPQLRHALWTIVAVRMLWPAGLPGFERSSLPIDPAVIPAWPATAVISSSTVALVWAIGAAILAGRWIVQARAARRRLVMLSKRESGGLPSLARAARRVGLRRLPAVFVDFAAGLPYVCGPWTPRLVLPAGWRAWSDDTLEYALAHELMHVRRRDLLLEAAWMALACVYWFHPLAHVARRRAHDAREMCCDAEVAGRLGPGYRLALLQAVAACARLEPVTAVPHRHAWHPAIARLHALERWPVPASPTQRFAGITILVAAAIVVLPSHVTIARPVPVATVEQLLDPSTRQRLGMGSLHLRYALLQAARNASEESAPRR